MNRAKLGSEAARGGFENEREITEKFSNWKNDETAKIWIQEMGYDLSKISTLKSVRIPPRINKKTALSLGISDSKFEDTLRFKKSDIQIRLEIIIDDVLHIENISCKKSNKNAGFNQVDKRKIDDYKMMWGIDEELIRWLKLFTGELDPEASLSKSIFTKLKSTKRIFIPEMPEEIQNEIISFFTNNKMLVLSDILRGKGGLSADWFLVTKKDETKISWVLSDINNAINIYSQGAVKVSPRGSLKIGRVTVQRKGGTPDPTSLQFKINPLELFKDKSGVEAG